MTFADLKRFSISKEKIRETDEYIRRSGRQRYECFVLWSGVRVPPQFLVRSIHLPRQTSYRLEEGLCVRVDGAELHRINRWLYENREEIGVQVHSHPRNAYHSETDSLFPIATTHGSLSIVVPEFGRHGLLGRGVAAYRLSDDIWSAVPIDDVLEVTE